MFDPFTENPDLQMLAAGVGVVLAPGVVGVVEVGGAQQQAPLAGMHPGTDVTGKPVQEEASAATFPYRAQPDKLDGT